MMHRSSKQEEKSDILTDNLKTSQPEKKRIEVAIAQLRSYDLATNTTLREIQKTSI